MQQSDGGGRDTPSVLLAVELENSPPKFKKKKFALLLALYVADLFFDVGFFPLVEHCFCLKASLFLQHTQANAIYLSVSAFLHWGGKTFPT